MPLKHGLQRSEPSRYDVDVRTGDYGIKCDECGIEPTDYRVLIGGLPMHFYCWRCFTLKMMDLVGSDV